MVYVHVPFCESRCLYCGFYSNRIGGEKDRETLFGTYLDAIIREIEERRDEIISSSPAVEDNTLYIGGGTPSVLPPFVISGIAGKLSSILPYDSFPEFTLEVNPEDIVEKGGGYVRALLECGVNRISMGVQSLDEDILRWMGRRHSAKGARKAVSILREEGLRNLSLDLIFGVPGLALEKWDRTLSDLLALGPDHISAYQLSFDEGSPLGRLLDEGKVSEVGQEECAAQYEMLCHRLRDEGFIHYEVSNFARPSFRARHNSAYWRRVPYVGLGPGAHSLQGEGHRTWNTPTFPSYHREEEFLSEEDIHVEEVMLSLRTMEGIHREALPGDTLSDFLNRGLLKETEDGRVRIPEEKFFVSDSIIRELI